MCGIVGYVGKKENALQVLINSLKTLEYRGYDSSGIAFFNDGQIKTIKEKGKINELEKLIDFKTLSNIGIAHTRWATCGIADKINAHPHSCEKITIVHNGIIENYDVLKDELQQEGCNFKSQTDSEVIAVLLNKYYKSNKDIIHSIVKLKKVLVGSYAIAILCSDFPDSIFAIRKDSPLIVARNDEASFVASDVPAILNYTDQYFILEEKEIAILKCDSIKVIDENSNIITKNFLTFEGDKASSQKGNFEHFMLKEIFEEKSVIKNVMEDYNNFDKLNKNMSFLKNYNKIDIVACGSAYHIGVIAKYLIEEYTKIPVNVEIASEYRYKNNFLDKNSLAIFISQSGETADTLASLRKIKNKGIDTLGIVNVKESSIAREVDNVIYTKAGPEIAVATTKAFISQLTVMILITLYLGYKNKNLKKEIVEKTISDINNIGNYIDKALNDSYSSVASILSKHDNIFFIGRNIDYGVALEGSLKLKEISYIHSEAYPAGELKHGTISLIDKGTPVISVITKESIFDKSISNIKEVKARGAHNIVISTKKITIADENILIPNINELILPILAVIPLQLIAYETAKLRDCDIDKPKNLAKSVTVE